MSLFTLFTSPDFAKKYPVQFALCLDGMMTYLREQSPKNREAVAELIYREVAKMYKPGVPPQWGQRLSCVAFADGLLSNLSAGDAALWIKLASAALACDYNLASRWLDALRRLPSSSIAPLRPTG